MAGEEESGGGGYRDTRTTWGNNVCVSRPPSYSLLFSKCFFRAPHRTQVFTQHIRPSQCHINGTLLYANANNNMTFDFPYEPRVKDGGSEEAVKEARGVFEPERGAGV
jgi:hypothetical protein